MTTPNKALLIQARDWIAGKGEIVFAGCGMAAVDKMNALHAALQAAIDAPEPEPKCVARIEVFGKDWRLDYLSLPVGMHALYAQTYSYTHPPAVREPLSDAEIIKIAQDNVAAEPGRDGYILPISFARAIEAAHGIGVKP